MRRSNRKVPNQQPPMPFSVSVVRQVASRVNHNQRTTRSKRQLEVIHFSPHRFAQRHFESERPASVLPVRFPIDERGRPHPFNLDLPFSSGPSTSEVGSWAIPPVAVCVEETRFFAQRTGCISLFARSPGKRIEQNSLEFRHENPIRRHRKAQLTEVDPVHPNHSRALNSIHLQRDKTLRAQNFAFAKRVAPQETTHTLLKGQHGALLFSRHEGRWIAKKPPGRFTWRRI